jgi:hypothetical protein
MDRKRTTGYVLPFWTKTLRNNAGTSCYECICTIGKAHATVFAESGWAINTRGSVRLQFSIRLKRFFSLSERLKRFVLVDLSFETRNACVVACFSLLHCSGARTERKYNAHFSV